MAIAQLTPKIANGLFEAGCVTLTTNRLRTVSVRPGDARDGELLAAMYRRLSERSIRLRYGAPRPSLPEAVIRAELDRVLAGDPRLTTALIGTVDEGGGRGAVAVAELVQLPADRQTAEIALLVRDDYQREGLGRALGRMLQQAALARGVRLLRAYLQADNLAIMRLIRGMGVRYTAETRRGETTILIPLEAD
jgi:acetyltransferase